MRSINALSSVLILVLPLAGMAQPAAGKMEPGLAVTFNSQVGGGSDLAVTPNLSLFIGASKAPTPFLPAGPFRATWEGTVSAELRSDFFFQAELNGNLKLVINDATVLDVSGTGNASPLSQAVHLRKGQNALRAEFTSPSKGDAFVRLFWTERGTNTSPIPLAVLNHASSPELQAAAELRLGRELFLEYRCANCHTADFTARAAVPELNANAPAFDGIGARRNSDWIARWVLDPKSLRPSAFMPRLLLGSDAKADAEAIASYLASLRGDAINRQAVRLNQPAPEREHTSDGKNLFEKLQCGSCHNPPDDQEPDSQKISLRHTAEKFSAGKLAEFLEAPEADFPWTRMPNFKLSTSEAKTLSNFIGASAERAPVPATAADPARLERGQKLVQNSGCLNCHSFKAANSFSAPKLPELSADKWARGCLAAEPRADSRAPRFEFSAVQRSALQAFGRTDRLSLTRHVPGEFAERQTRLLRCGSCHGQIELVPPLNILGAKLKPEWAAQFMAGEISYKPRAEKHPRGESWMEARMPAFRTHANWLAEGLAAEHGLPPRTAAEPPVDLQMAKIGQKLASKDAGFSCTSCHGIGPVEATEVVESEGINLAYSAERLLPSYYRRWLRSPISIDPQTKMPVYFDEGKSPLTEILEGDPEKQIDALWQYIRLSGKMPP